MPVISGRRTLDDVAAWALRATIFGRMYATAYPTGNGPSEISQCLDNLWRCSAEVARLDGELQASLRRNEDLQRKGREFRAQVGRRIEDLSREQSRLKREIASASVDLNRLKEEYEQASDELERAREIIASVDKGRDEMPDDLRQAYETAGAAAARRQGRAEAVAKVESKIKKWQTECDRIDDQLIEYRRQLDRHSAGIEDDLESGRRRLAEKVQERESVAVTLTNSAQLLTDHFRNRSEVSAIFAELSEFERVSEIAPPPHARS
jgi:chromosome segregation ATPase